MSKNYFTTMSFRPTGHCESTNATKYKYFEFGFRKKLQKSGIYFAQSLPKSIDDLHDDHYHIDFEFLKKKGQWMEFPTGFHGYFQ